MPHGGGDGGGVFILADIPFTNSWSGPQKFGKQQTTSREARVCLMTVNNERIIFIVITGSFG